MAKREMSTTLKNLKFMQRATKKEEKPKEEEIKADGNFLSPSNVNRKCVVIMEGDPHPGTVRGRMSFQNFNPSIDKLNDAAANGREAEASTSCGFQSGRDFDRENNCIMDTDDTDDKRKRKQKLTEADNQTGFPKKQKTPQGNKQSSPTENHSSHKQPKHGKLDWNVLVPSGSQSKKKGN